MEFLKYKKQAIDGQRRIDAMSIEKLMDRLQKTSLEDLARHTDKDEVVSENAAYETLRYTLRKLLHGEDFKRGVFLWLSAGQTRPEKLAKVLPTKVMAVHSTIELMFKEALDLADKVDLKTQERMAATLIGLSDMGFEYFHRNALGKMITSPFLKLCQERLHENNFQSRLAPYHLSEKQRLFIDIVVLNWMASHPEDTKELLEEGTDFVDNLALAGCVNALNHLHKDHDIHPYIPEGRMAYKTLSWLAKDHANLLKNEYDALSFINNILADTHLFAKENGYVSPACERVLLDALCEAAKHIDVWEHINGNGDAPEKLMKLILRAGTDETIQALGGWKGYNLDCVEKEIYRHFDNDFKRKDATLSKRASEWKRISHIYDQIKEDLENTASLRNGM